jgi:lipoprotein-anchoring transpeptidase ErfK/SrfK
MKNPSRFEREAFPQKEKLRTCGIPMLRLISRVVMNSHSSYLRSVLLPIILFAHIMTSLAAETKTTPATKITPAKIRPASELIAAQQPGKVYNNILERASSEPLSVVVSLSKQRVYLLVGGKLAVDSPISSGRRPGWTPMGNFTVMEKDLNHSSSLYGNFVDHSGSVVRSGVSSRHDAAPSGTRFSGAPMKYFMRLTPQGVGLHAGILPGYPASHGCIRLPHEMAQLIYSKVGINTPVTVGE